MKTQTLRSHYRVFWSLFLFALKNKYFFFNRHYLGIILLMWTLIASTCSTQLKWEAPMFSVFRIKLKLLGKSSLQNVIPGQSDMEKPLGDNHAYLRPWRTLEIILLCDRIPRLHLTRSSSQMFKNKCPVSLTNVLEAALLHPPSPAQPSYWALTLTQQASKQSIFRSPDEWPYTAVKCYSRACTWRHPANCCPTRYAHISWGCQVTEFFIWLLQYSNYLKYFQKQCRALHELPSWYSTTRGWCWSSNTSKQGYSLSSSLVSVTITVW